LLTVEGLHVPVIPFMDVVDNDGTPPPAQIDKEEPKLKTGVKTGLTVTLKLVVVAH
jgi:hypothetical protein